MKLLALTTLAALAYAQLPIYNITLTKCPTPNDRSPSCYNNGPQVVYYNDTYNPNENPNRRRSTSLSILDWDAEYAVTWDSSSSTQPVFFTWNASGYNVTKEISGHEEARISFAFKDLAKQMLRLKNETDHDLQDRILGAAANGSPIHLSRDWEEKYGVPRYDVPPGAFPASILPYDAIEVFDIRLERALDNTRQQQHEALKKWKIGVGAGVGVGVPVLLAIFTTAGYMFGKTRASTISPEKWFIFRNGICYNILSREL